MSQRTLLLSLRPRFADAILSGTKTVELRRRPINAQPGTLVILYSSAPVMAIVGTARLRQVMVSDPQTAWGNHHSALGLQKDEYDGYLDGSPLAYLLHLTQVCTLNEPLHLHRLRQDGGFHPPQSFRYVAPSDPLPLRELVGTQQRDGGH
ncbi:ASCH domain-containing protein [Micromonospora chersina]|uniref:ASCH domain-containing protein n=1 Tax=Micromonospora chersina TaxID=47854 RepID=UPI0033E5D2AE